MPQETIVFSQGIELPPDVQALAQDMKPTGVNLVHLPPTASVDDIAAAMQDAEYLLGFLRFIPDEAFQKASRLKLIQVLSAGYDRVNIAGARAARVPTLHQWRRQFSRRGGARHHVNAGCLPQARHLPSECRCRAVESGHTTHRRHLRVGRQNGRHRRLGQYRATGGQTPQSV